jgi:histone H2B
MAKAAKKSTSTKVAKKRSTRKGKRTWNTYVHRSLKQVNKNMSLSKRTMAVLNSFVSDLFERIANEAASLARINKKRTLGSREVQTAVRLVLPTELAKHAMSEGTKAVAKVSA